MPDYLTAAPKVAVQAEYQSMDQAQEAARDRVLTERAMAGDREAFAKLYDTYERRIYGNCLRICGNPEDAEDATHEAFATVLRRLSDIGEIKNFSGYLFVVSRTAALRVIKRNGRATPTAEVPEPDNNGGVAAEEDPERALLLHEQRSNVMSACNRLVRRQREVLLLREVKGLSYDEVGKEIGASRSAVAQLIFRARMRLREAVRTTAIAQMPLTDGCHKALPLMSQRLDGELDEQGCDWLDEHLACCDCCKANLQAIEEAGATYRSVAPWIAAPALFGTLINSTDAHATKPASAQAGSARRERGRHDPARRHEGRSSRHPEGARRVGRNGAVRLRVARRGSRSQRRKALAANVGTALLALLITAAVSDGRLIPGGESARDNAAATLSAGSGEPSDNVRETSATTSWHNATRSEHKHRITGATHKRPHSSDSRTTSDAAVSTGSAGCRDCGAAMTGDRRARRPKHANPPSRRLRHRLRRQGTSPSAATPRSSGRHDGGAPYQAGTSPSMDASTGEPIHAAPADDSGAPSTAPSSTTDPASSRGAADGPSTAPPGAP